LKGKIEKPESTGEADYAKYLKRQSIFGIVNQGSDIEIQPIQLSLKEKIYKKLYHVSDSFEASLNRLFPEPEASLANGLILGLKKNLPDDYMDALNATGLTHLVALSGYNVTIVIRVLSCLLLGYLSRKKILALGTFIVVLFVLLTGAASSVVRAAIFSILLLFGGSLGRKADNTNLMLLAAVAMVLLNPYVLRYDLGFQLSFLAFAGLIYISPIIKKILSKEKYNFIPEFIKAPLTETLSAQAAVFPLLVMQFGRLSLIAPIANVAVLWIVPYAMAISFVSGLVGLIYYPLGKAVSFISWPILEYIVKVPELFAHIPLASIEFQKSYWYVEMLMFAALAVIVKIYYRKFKLSI
jgi:competence protein ComEC